MGYYPIFLEVAEKPVLLVGGGHVALEKIGRLVESGAQVTVVAPDLIPPVRAFIDDDRARWVARPFEPGDTEGYFLVMVATDDGEVNRSVADEARGRGILVNAADDIANCDFILPSVARAGSLQIASSTGGGSPAMARWLREQMEEFLSDDVVALADLLAEVRTDIRRGDRECAGQCTRAKTPPPLLCDECPNRIPADRWQNAINGGVLALLREGRQSEARSLLVETLQRSELTPAPWWKAPVL